MEKLSAVDAASPAFAHAKRQLFEPFRWVFWARLALIALLTGEFAGGSGSGATFNIPAGVFDRGRKDFLQLDPGLGGQLERYLPWIIVGVLALFALGAIALYIASVFRFVLLDTVLTGRAHLIEGWRRWQDVGGRFFLWQLGFGVVMLVILGGVVALPVWHAIRTGVFKKPEASIGTIILGFLAVFLIAGAITLIGLLINTLAKDFVVPLMALENLGVVEAWQRLLGLLAADRMGYVGYILMKIVLTIGSAILFGFVNLMVIIVMTLALGVVGLVLFLVGRAVGLSWDLYTLGAAVVLASLAVMAVLYAVAFASSPAIVFFQAYAVHFFAPRYPVLALHLTRSPGVQTPLATPPEFPLPSAP